MLKKLAFLLALVALAAANQAAQVEESLENGLQGGDREAKFGGLLSSSTNMIANMARQLVTQSYANSQVLSLNLSNVLILLLLKAVLFSIGHYSATQGGKGFGGGGWWGRSGDPDTQPRGLPEGVQSESIVTEGELKLALGYLTAEGSRDGDMGCLYRAACEDYDGRAPKYLEAGRMILKAANVVSSVLPINPKYGRMADGYEEALMYGAQRGNCAVKYRCLPQ